MSLDVDPDGLRSTTPGFTSASDAAAKALAALQQVIHAEGECWGNDKPGKTFAGSYTGRATAATGQVDSLGKLVSGLGTAMTTIATAFDQHDDAAAAAIAAVWNQQQQ